MAEIIFSLRARTRIEQMLAPRLAQEPNLLETELQDVRSRLQAIFTEPVRYVLVQSIYAGFRVREKQYILLVEVAESGSRDGLNVVKIGPAEKLQEEWDGWQSCRPHGLQHDAILMTLTRSPVDGETIQALLYADAQQFIGVDETISLERAMREAIRLGEPKLESVADALFQIYERLSLLLYRHSWDTDLSDRNIPFQDNDLDKRLTSNLERWQNPEGHPFLAAIVTKVHDTSSDSDLMDLILDPVLFISTVLKSCQSPGPRPLPRMLRGRTHGDLHARNVLVGRVGDRVVWPAIYDFGDMSRNGWIARDFVKMEVELRVRVYPEILPQVAIGPVLRLEERMFRETEEARRSGNWPEVPQTNDPVERLVYVVLTIRRLAARHLSQQGRSRLWLNEYYFHLAVYPLNAARFENLEWNEILAAYWIAGAAAARYWYFNGGNPNDETSN